MGQRVDSHVGQRVDSRVGQRVLRTALKRYSARTFYIWNKNGLVPRVDAEYHGFAFFRGFVTTPCCTLLVPEHYVPFVVSCVLVVVVDQFFSVCFFSFALGIFFTTDTHISKSRSVLRPYNNIRHKNKTPDSNAVHKI